MPVDSVSVKFSVSSKTVYRCVTTNYRFMTDMFLNLLLFLQYNAKTDSQIQISYKRHFKA